MLRVCSYRMPWNCTSEHYATLGGGSQEGEGGGGVDGEESEELEPGHAVQGVVRSRLRLGLAYTG